IADGSLATAKFQDNAVTSSKIANRAVQRTKLDTTGAAANQALIYNGTNVVWGQINAENAITANDASHLNWFDWTSCFSGGNPAAGTLNVASVITRGDSDLRGQLVVSGRTFLNGAVTLVQGSFIAQSVGGNMWLNDNGLFLRGVGDFNHVL